MKELNLTKESVLQYQDAARPNKAIELKMMEDWLIMYDLLHPEETCQDETS